MRVFALSLTAIGLWEQTCLLSDFSCILFKNKKLARESHLFQPYVLGFATPRLKTGESVHAEGFQNNRADISALHLD